MKTVLYMSLNASGQIAQPDEKHPILREILGDFFQHVLKAGNVVVGRRTYELMTRQASEGGAAEIETVVVSHSSFEGKAVEAVSTPQEALRYLAQKGFETALVGGGAQLDSSFLSEGLVDVIVLNVEPFATARGTFLGVARGFDADLHLVGTAKLSDDIVQIKYEVRK
ncbi:MAG: dihydrofolate reductase family protein [Spirochaetia bacterium]